MNKSNLSFRIELVGIECCCPVNVLPGPFCEKKSTVVVYEYTAHCSSYLVYLCNIAHCVSTVQVALHLIALIANEMVNFDTVLAYFYNSATCEKSLDGSVLATTSLY